VLELNASGNLTVLGISVATTGNFSGHNFSFILLATVSGDFSFVNVHCILTVVGFQSNRFDTWCDEMGEMARIFLAQ
jgi:hypothetical protein